jgi:predicted transcriptional regulator
MAGKLLPTASKQGLACSMTFSYHKDMPNRAIKKTISLPKELVRELQEQARAERKTLSGVIQEALWAARRARLTAQFQELQGYWSERAKQKGLVTERDLERYLER